MNPNITGNISRYFSFMHENNYYNSKLKKNKKMAKSKRWSMKDIKVIKKYISHAKNEGMEETVGLKAAATHFGVTINAVRIRWGRYNQGEGISDLNKGTTKIPMNRKKRKNTSTTFVEVASKATKEDLAALRKAPVTHNVYSVAREITFDIRDIKVDLVNKKLTIIY